ncbi:MAG: Rpn family recombination-promoting nuclease/putative transposase [Oscillospiraceae bacterium]|nr:Rpn family recombination-promoting nuclease/putative transposase [Oscillospiraceae bacterium]
MKLNYHSHFCPSNDIVFSVMYSKRYLFSELISAITGDEIELDEEPHSQASLREDDVLLNSIRFDVFSTANNKRIYTADMQRSYKEARLVNRTVYYSCRALSTQVVDNMNYEDLKPVNICFILTSHNNKKAIRRIKFCDVDDHDVYSDVIEITLVYVKTVLKSKDKKSKLYLLARFFDISSQKKADKFVLEFENTKLEKELIVMYNKSVASVNNLRKIESSPYFTERLNEAQLEEERKKAAEKAAKKESEKWQGVIKEVISEKDTIISEKDALIAELKKRLGDN